MKSLAQRLVARLGMFRALGLCATVVLSVGFLLGLPFLDLLELKTYDLRIRATATAQVPQHVAVVSIDDRSLAEVGRWPWRRQTLAQLVDRIAQAGASVVVMGVLFAEPENQALVEEIEALDSPALTPGARAAVRASLSTDEALAQALRAQGRVVLPVALVEAPVEASAIPGTLVGVDALPVRLVLADQNAAVSWSGEAPTLAISSIDSLQSQARAIGHINTRPDIDGTIRRVSLALPLQDRWVASADLVAAALHSGVDRLDLLADRFGISAVAFGTRRIDTDEQAVAWVRYAGPAGTVPTVAAVDILSGQADLSALRGRVVLIGPTATGIDSPAPSPFDSRLSGIEIRATTIQNLIDGSTLTRPRWIRVVEFAQLLVLGTLLTWALARLGIVVSSTVCALLVALLVGASVAAFERQLVLEVTYPVTLVLTLYLMHAVDRYLRTSREKRQIRSAFQYYVPSKVVDEITRDITKLQLGGDKRELTVLFSDIRGFTSLAEQMAPEALVQLLNGYLTQMTEKVFIHDGLLDKYIGDAVMAVYGAPIHRPDHAVLACRTALDMIAALQALQDAWKRAGLPVLDIGIGINTGPMIVGNMGSDTRFDYTVIGDAVNLGSRIESMNKTYGTQILISESTYQAVRDEFTHIRQVDVAAIRGRASAVGLYELMPPGVYPGLDWLPEYERAYRLDQAGSTREAAEIFEALHGATGDPVSAYHLQRIRGR